MKYAILILFLTSLAGATTSRLRDGRPEFVKYVVNGKDCWSDEEKDKEVDKYNVSNATFPLSLVTVTPSNFELTVASSNIKFDNYTDFQNSLSIKGYITDKIDDLPPSQSKKIKSSTDYLKSEDSKK